MRHRGQIDNRFIIGSSCASDNYKGRKAAIWSVCNEGGRMEIKVTADRVAPEEARCAIEGRLQCCDETMLAAHPSHVVC